ncbi:adenylyl-sulfate kinase [Nocardioides piscis]|uniref:adenylyl-sulfate kinase n=1 Tax=Nocardioides piscis TaxID=2714938 RepID=UPI00197D0D5E|nr:adenylyl-sulfate kinase [Nocardioides piscis]
MLFFTGLSGSGKSTLARALMDRVLEQGVRSVTSLDGDVVRRNLSAGLTFSKADRETNIRRIGWVAAEIARHGGLAICSPIAPFAETRADVRAMVEEAGGAFFLVHVATPLEECERRDRKGLYAKARRGEIPEFTGISSPYEEPEDAAVRVDTTGRSIDEALDDVLDALQEAGHLDLRSTLPEVEEGRRPEPEVEEGRRPEPEVEEGRSPQPEVEEGRSPQPEVEEGRRPVTKPQDPIHVLFVCTANICRSPFLEQTARALAGDAHITFASAGTHGFDSHPMDEVMAATLEPADADFRSQPLTRAVVESADLILTAESSHRTFVLEEHPAAWRKVFTLGQFCRAVEATPNLHGRALIESAGQRRTAPLPQDDIADPYRRGAAAAETAAGRMTAMVRGIVRALTEEN